MTAAHQYHPITPKWATDRRAFCHDHPNTLARGSTGDNAPPELAHCSRFAVIKCRRRTAVLLYDIRANPHTRTLSTDDLPAVRAVLARIRHGIENGRQMLQDGFTPNRFKTAEQQAENIRRILAGFEEAHRRAAADYGLQAEVEAQQQARHRAHQADNRAAGARHHWRATHPRP